MSDPREEQDIVKRLRDCMSDPITRVLENCPAHDRALDAMNRSAAVLTEQAIERIAESYQRERDLPKLFSKLAGLSSAEIIAALERAVKSQEWAIETNHYSASQSRLWATRGALLSERRAAIRRAA